MPLDELILSLFVPDRLTTMADDFLTQVHFTGESSCVKFAPNPFKGNICVTCSKEIFKHNKSSIESKEVLMKVGYSTIASYTSLMISYIPHKNWLLKR